MQDPPRIRSATPGDAAEVGAVIADAFADDAVNLWLFNGARAMAPTYRALARWLYLVRGFGHVLENGSAAALWLPPGEKKSLGFRGSLAAGAPLLRFGGPTALRRVTIYDAFMDARKPRAPHYYLFSIGVRSHLQGRGLGAHVLRAGLDRCDRDGVPAFLESSKESNVAFYERSGFRVTEVVRPPAGCPPLWLMWREPESGRGDEGGDPVGHEVGVGDREHVTPALDDE